MKYWIFGFIILANFNNEVLAQGSLTGNFQVNMDFYQRDTAIGAVGPNYQYNKTSNNAWMQAIYTNQDWGFEASLRFDANNNSILQNPPNPITYNGIGIWYLKKKIDNLEVTGGYFYEQFGTGISFRAYEARSLGIDNALFGVRVKYKFSNAIKFTGVLGEQKNKLGLFDAFVKGGMLEVSKSWEDGVSVNGGLAVTNRTLSQNTRSELDKIISTYPQQLYFPVHYNDLIFHGFNTLSFKNFSWFIEAAYKTPDVVNNPRLQYNYYKKWGISIQNTLSFNVPGFGLSFQNRFIQNFQFESSPLSTSDFNEAFNRRISYIAPINRQNSLRLPARFQTAPQDIGEMASSLDIIFSPFKNAVSNLNLCMIDTVDFSSPYYREVYFDTEVKNLIKGKMKIHFGGQYVFYNQQQYQQEGVPNVEAVTIFTEFSYKFNKKNSLRIEYQYQSAPKELGQSMFGLIEYNIAPKFSFSISDLWNFKPNPNYFVEQYHKPHHFYSLFAAFTHKTTRFTIGYVKQLAGIVCTGGVCRFEPAFSGIRTQLITSF